MNDNEIRMDKSDARSDRDDVRMDRMDLRIDGVNARVDLLRDLFTDLHNRMGRVERSVYILCGFVAGLGIIEVTKLVLGS